MAAARALSTTESTGAVCMPFKALLRFLGKAVSCFIALLGARFSLQCFHVATRGQLARRSVKLRRRALRDWRW